jgi:glycosyltransferase involved in cell wall biosynthesis
MHLLLIHQAFVSPNEPGGTRHYELTKYLVQNGHDVTILASNISYLTGKSVLKLHGLFGKENLEGINLLRAYTYSSLHKSFIWRVVSFISFMISSIITALTVKNIDLVMGTSPPIFQAFSAWVVAIIKRKQFILEIRDLWPEFAIDMGVLKNKTLILMSKWLEKFLYSRARHFIVNSPAYRDYLMSKGVSEYKISFISNGVDPQMFLENADETAFRKKWQLGNDFLVTYTGALGLANDIPVILRTAHRLSEYPDIKFLFVGDGKERKNLENLADELCLKNVIFTGSVPKSEMSAIISTSDLCVATLQDIPMFKTTYPNKVFDYMACAKPTLLAIDGVIREVIESSGGGVFVPPGDDESLAKTIKDLKANPETLRNMGLSARSYVSQNFDRKNQAVQFRDLLETISSEKNL